MTDLLTIGDRVTLASGGPEMTVEDISDRATYCVWHDGEDYCRDSFPTAGLVRVRARGKLRVVAGKEAGE
jgi:uncharacterized protein YodC (DUF2158 family)